MHRTIKATLATLLASSFMAADALALEPYMWGVGGRLGTMAVPAKFPLSFPTKISGYNFLDEGPRAGDDKNDDPNRDLDADGNPRFSELQKSGFDLQLSADGFYGIDEKNRIGAMAGFTAGKFTDLFFMLNYDRVLFSDNDSSFDVVAGGYVGVGQMSFRAPDNGVEKLRVPHFPIRAHIEADLRNKTQKYGLGIFAGTNVPSNHFYTDLDGNERDDVGSPFNLALYVHAGVELSVQFGDFTPPKKKKKGGPAKKGGGKKKGGGAKKGGGGGKKK
jgi:hypothetical protein